MDKSNGWHWTCGRCQADHREAEHPRHCPDCGSSRREGGSSWQDMKSGR